VATGKVAGAKGRMTNPYRRYAPVCGAILLTLFGSVIFSVFYLERIGAASEIGISAETGVKNYNRTFDDARNDKNLEYYEIEFDLVEKNRKGVSFLASVQRRGILTEQIFSLSKNHCLRQFQIYGKMDSCIIFYKHPESQIKSSDLQAGLKNLASVWLRDDIVAVYTFDPDDSSERRRLDELFMIDCNFFSKEPKLVWIICKSSPEDPISNQLKREEKIEAERKKAMAADAATADAMAEPF
jgi:hypothetical protein